MSEDPILSGVVQAVADWLDQTTRLGASRRLNMRTDIVPAEGEEALRHALAALPGPKRAFVVMTSRHEKAVEMRNARGTQGIGLIYLVLWHEGSREHANNAESLRNLNRVDAAKLLGDGEFTFAGEAEVALRIHALSATAPATRDHVLAAWSALREVLRDQSRPVPLANRVDSYVRYLVGLDPQTAPTLDALVERWGAVLPELGLFRFPALGRMLGVHTDLTLQPDVAARQREKQRKADLRTELLMNQECTIDFASLHDRIAGRGDLKVHMEDLDRQNFRLSARAPDIARRSFEEFCRSGDRRALVDAEWAWQDESRRIQGVRGVLVQRRIVTPRVDPLVSLLADTSAIFQGTSVADTVSAQVARRRQAPEFDSPIRRLLVALGDGRPEDPTTDAALEELAIGAGESCRQDLVALLAGDPHFSAKAAKLAVRWAPKVAEQASVRHPRLLEGIMRVVAARLEDGGTLSGSLVLTASGRSRAELDWSRLDPDTLSDWLGQVMEEAAREAIDDDDAGEPVRVQVALQKDGRALLGEIELDGEDLARPAAATTAQVGFGDAQRVLPLRLAALQDAWQGYQVSWTSGRGPVPPAAAGWVQAWAAQVSAAGNAGQTAAAQISRLERRLIEISDATEDLSESDGNEAAIAALTAERKVLRAERLSLRPVGAEPAQPSVDDDTCRELLQVCTVRDDPSDPAVLELSPHHPLCLRLRIARETLILGVLRAVLAGTATIEGNAELRRWAAEELGPEDFPVPLHSYGVVAREPLLFDGWRASGAARFQRADRAGEAERGRLGLAPVTRVVRDYRRIFAATARAQSPADRLQLQIGGDTEGAWAWAVTERLCEDPAVEFDVGLARAPAAPSRPRALDRATYNHPELFAPRRDGRPARVVMGTRPLARPHLSLDIGEHLGFRGAFRSRPMGDPPPASDAALLFSVPLLRLDGSALAVADPADQLCVRIRALIERVANGQGSTYTYDFDPDQHSERLRQAQGGAHWLVLVSRFPVHRAVQLAAQREEAQGRPFASLIDFWTTRDRGRPLYVSCSLHAGGGAFGDTALVAALRKLGLDLELNAILRAARSVAPKAAIALLRGQYRPEIQGILGLLLTAAHARGHGSGERVLALDQHTELLSGTGERSDLVCARLDDGALSLRVIEAKLSAGALVPGHTLPQKGRSQISNTVARLKHFETDHPLAARTRRRLLDALADAATLAGDDAGGDPLVAAALNLSVPIRVAGATSGEVHAWALEGGSRTDSPPAEALIVVHGGDETRAALERLAKG